MLLLSRLCACLGVRVGSGGMLGVLPGAHVVHEAGSKDTVWAWGLLASWDLGLVSVALFRPRVRPTIPLPGSRWEFGAESVCLLLICVYVFASVD